MSKRPCYLWATAHLPKDYDYLAPDGSKIHLLSQVGGRGLSHCTLPAGCATNAVFHISVDEIWYFVSEKGWGRRKRGRQEAVERVGPGACLSIPCSTCFQFRNTGDEPLCLGIATLPSWPGPRETVETDGYWSQSTYPPSS